MSIGIITSTKFSGRIREAFLKGLRANGWEGDPGASPGSHPPVSILLYEADGSYDDGDGDSGKRKELYNAVSAFDADPGVDLIIATGGLVSAHAAVKRSTHKPFLVLFGTKPNFDLSSNPNYRGGVNLDMVAKDAERNAQLCSMSGIADAKKVCLIWSSRSKMGRQEKKAWVNDNGWPLAQEVKKNADSDIAAAFVKAKSSGAKGIVVSGDPYFTSHMNALVTAANSSRLKICYPFGVYANAIPAPAAGSGIYLGPDLESAYGEIGKMAGTILGAIASGGSAPSTGLTVAKTGKPKPVAKKK
jgi:hypothetical protein